MSRPLYWLRGPVGLHWTLSIYFSAHSSMGFRNNGMCVYVRMCMCKTVHTVEVNAYRCQPIGAVAQCIYRGTPIIWTHFATRNVNVPLPCPTPDPPLPHPAPPPAPPCSIPEPKVHKRPTTFFRDGKPVNINEGRLGSANSIEQLQACESHYPGPSPTRYDFSLTEDDDLNQFVLDLACPRFMDPSLMEVDVQPLYIRVSLKGKVCRNRLVSTCLSSSVTSLSLA